MARHIGFGTERQRDDGVASGGTGRRGWLLPAIFLLIPLGFAIGPTQPMQDLWFSIFLGWIAKSVTLRYGGYKAYRAALPAFLGIILGQAVGCAGWLIVDGIAGTTGNMVYVY